MLPQPNVEAPQVATPALHIFQSSRSTRCSKKRNLLEWLRGNEAPRPNLLLTVAADDAALQEFKARFESLVQDLFRELTGEETGYLCVDKALKISSGIVEGRFPKSNTPERRLLIENACLFTQRGDEQPARGMTCMTVARQKGTETTNALNVYLFLHPSVAWSPALVHAMAGNLRTVGVRTEAGNVLQESIIMQLIEISVKSNITPCVFFHRIVCGNLYSDPHGAVEDEDSESDLDLDGGRRSQAPSPEPQVGPGPSNAGGSRPTPTAKRRASEDLQETSELNHAKTGRVKTESSPLGGEGAATPMATVFDFDIQNCTPAQTTAAMRSMVNKTSVLQAALEKANDEQEKEKAAREQAEKRVREAEERVEKIEKMLEEEKAGRRADTEVFRMALAALLR